jgi:hypothetical protein
MLLVIGEDEQGLPTETIMLEPMCHDSMMRCARGWKSCCRTGLAAR